MGIVGSGGCSISPLPPEWRGSERGWQSCSERIMDAPHNELPHSHPTPSNSPSQWEGEKMRRLVERALVAPQRSRLIRKENLSEIHDRENTRGLAVIKDMKPRGAFASGSYYGHNHSG